MPSLDDPRWNPEMRAVILQGAKAASELPLLRPDASPEQERAHNEKLSAAAGRSGPAMAEITNTWVAVRGRRIYCRVYRPRTDKLLPAAIYFHGGGWYFSSVDTHDCVARTYAAAGEIAVISVDYALAPEAKFPQAVEECAAVAQHVASHAAEWNIDGERLLLLGDSAGGNLALAAALILRDRKWPPLRGVLAAYPVCDSDFDTPSYREFGDGPLLTADRMRFFWRTYVKHPADMLHPWAAPLRADLTQLPPMLLHVGELDVLRSEVEAFANKLARSNVRVNFEIFPGLAHGFMRATEAIALARQARDKAGEWIRQVVAPTGK
ncbi:MAG: alpha/beta hydrolase [Xanthobacteraceae bacterium]